VAQVNLSTGQFADVGDDFDEPQPTGYDNPNIQTAERIDIDEELPF
jgi:hypothetical protein